MEATGGVDEHEPCPAPLGLVDDVVADARGVRAALARHDVDARALSPDLELLDGRGAERVSPADEAGDTVAVRLPGELAHRGGLARAVDAHEEHTAGKVGERVALGGHELGGEPLGERLAELGGTRDVLARGLLAQVIGHA